MGDSQVEYRKHLGNYYVSAWDDRHHEINKTMSFEGKQKGLKKSTFKLRRSNKHYLKLKKLV